MRLEIPNCNRCCYCVPLRHGILIFGYLSMALAILQLVLESLYAHNQQSGIAGKMTTYHGVNIYAHVWFTVLLYVLEIIFIALLLFGAHMKKELYIRVYYYYGITTLLAATVLEFLNICFDQWTRFRFYAVLEASTAFCGLVIHVYLLLLVRTELRKLRASRCGVGAWVGEARSTELTQPLTPAQPDSIRVHTTAPTRNS